MLAWHPVSGVMVSKGEANGYTTSIQSSQKH